MDHDERESIEKELEREVNFQKRQHLMKRLWLLVKNGNPTPSSSLESDTSTNSNGEKGVQTKRLSMS